MIDIIVIVLTIFFFSVDHFHVPLVVSSPHFYLADQKYVDAIDGMKPNWMEHNTHLDIEPVKIFTVTHEHDDNISRGTSPDSFLNI